MKTLLSIATLCLAACATGKAPGTNPGDMSAAHHRQACIDHKRLAAAYRQRAESLHGGKGTFTAEGSARIEDDIARQHDTAAHQVDPNVSDCALPDAVVQAR